MRVPGAVSLLYLLYVAVVLPMAAIKSKRRFDRAHAPDAGPGSELTRTTIYASTLASLTILFLLSWAAGRTFEYSLFRMERLGNREVGIGLAALSFQFVMMLTARAVRPPEERRSMAVYKLVPRTPAEWALFVAVCVAAGIAEEAAYRGVFVAIVSYSTGSFLLACGLSSLVFAAAHAVQGWKSGVVIFVMALSMHVVAALTDTLVVGMVVHAAYDVCAGAIGAWRIRGGHVEG